MRVKLKSLFDSKMKVYLSMLKQGINIKTMCPNYILKFRNTEPHLMQVYLHVGVWDKIEIVIKNHVC